ncbi:Uncharacterized protein APZ42_020267 [Daphnia magna]|uniref:Uncharacterized protein n=1 Tax=Daphnia magna TaxID=35525 RepID=A0A164XMP4_9CRUS|nr:Uncharacterized protein APZ42_020267 [Daphnia magna]
MQRPPVSDLLFLLHPNQTFLDTVPKMFKRPVFIVLNTRLECPGNDLSIKIEEGGTMGSYAP